MAEQTEQAPFEGRRCPVYAFTPMRILGLSAGSALTAGVMFVLVYRFTGSVIGLLIAFVVGYFGEKLTNHKEPGFALQWVSARATGWVCHKIAQTWRRVGALPPPNHQRTYEP